MQAVVGFVLEVAEVHSCHGRQDPQDREAKRRAEQVQIVEHMVGVVVPDEEVVLCEAAVLGKLGRHDDLGVLAGELVFQTVAAGVPEIVVEAPPHAL